MSIDYLFELERQVEGGRDVYGCPGMGRNQWVLAKSLEDLKKPAQRAAEAQKIPITLVRLMSKSEAVGGIQFLVPTEIGDPGPRGEPQIKWKVVDTKEAAEMFKDVRRGPPPYFGIEILETISPAS